VQPVPSGKYITGTSGILDLSGENWEESAVISSDGVHLNWYDPIGMMKSDDQSYKEFSRQIRQFFDQAAGYIKRRDPVEKNPKFEAMRPVLNGTGKLYIHVNTSRGIMQALLFSRSYGITPVVVGGSESWMIADTLAARNVPVVLNKIHRLPGLPGDDVNMPFKIPTLLHKAGVKFCISVEGSWECRNLPFNAGTASAWGLGDEESLRAVSLSVAEITGTSGQIGSLESGKQASFVITEGNILEMSGNKMSYILIRGKELPVGDLQQQLYQKYHQKYFGTPGQ
jgi:imidazolonepropionase-like amidohydrolase